MSMQTHQFLHIFIFMADIQIERANQLRLKANCHLEAWVVMKKKWYWNTGWSEKYCYFNQWNIWIDWIKSFKRWRKKENEKTIAWHFIPTLYYTNGLFRKLWRTMMKISNPLFFPFVSFYWRQVRIFWQPAELQKETQRMNNEWHQIFIHSIVLYLFFVLDIEEIESKWHSSEYQKQCGCV